MIKIDLPTAQTLIQAIQNKNSPIQGSDAIAVRDKWLIEHDLGLVQMTKQVRSLLEATENFN